MVCFLFALPVEYCILSLIVLMGDFTMFERIQKSKLMFWSLELLIVAVLIWVCTKIDFLFAPIGTFFSTIFMPVLLAGVLFYMLNPIVMRLEKVKLGKFRFNHTGAVAVVFILLLLLFIGALAWLIPKLIGQVGNLVTNIPNFVDVIKRVLGEWNQRLSHIGWLKTVDYESYANQIQSGLSDYAKTFMSGLTSSVGTVIGMATSITVVAITVPVMLFYMLKDGQKLKPAIKRFLPRKHAEQTMDLLSQMSNTISNYIGGQLIEVLFVMVFTSMGFALVGEKYALLLGIFAGMCNIIPYVGPYIGVLPALIVAIESGLMQVILVAVVTVVVQQIDGNFIFPNVIGRSLSIHPLTIIIILLVAGNIAGLLGMILGVPLYAIVKVIVEFIYHVSHISDKAASTTPES